MLQVNNLSRYYEMASGTVKALDGINLRVEKGDQILLLGPSGSGKTTLLNCLAALDSPTGGEYSFEGSPVPRDKSENMTTFRRENIGYVFQFFNLLQDLTVLENILLIQEVSGRRDKDRALELLRLVGLEDERDRFPAEISGGQQQRVAIARAIINKPSLLLADEPTGALDSSTTEDVLNLFDELHNQGITLVLVTHENEVAKRAKRTAFFKDGKIIKIS